MPDNFYLCNKYLGYHNGFLEIHAIKFSKNELKRRFLKMDKLNFYGLCAKSTGVLSNIGYAFDDVTMSKYMVEELKKIEKDIPEDRKAYVLESIHDCYIVKIGSLDLENHNLENDYTILVDLKDFKFENIENDKSEG